MITHVTDYQTAGPALLIERYRKPIIVSLLKSWLAEVQQVEDAFWQLLTERAVETAVGMQLDMLGRLVGQPREGRPDEVYRAWVAARILVQKSSGKTEQLIAVAKKLLGANVPIRIEEMFPASQIIHTDAAIDPTAGGVKAKLLAAAKAAGVSLQFEWFSNLAGTPFSFAPGSVSETGSASGYDNGALAAISNGYDAPFVESALVPPPSEALLFDGDSQPMTSDDDSSYLTLG